jgi:hypothetical protein
VSAFSKHQTFLEDEINLDITGYNWEERRVEVENWYMERDLVLKHDFLIQNNIKYIYWIKDSGAVLDTGKLSLSSIFENNLVILYRVE